MFDTNVTHLRSCNNIKIQACPGGIYKSHPKSKIVNMQFGSTLAKRIFSEKTPQDLDNKDVVVLQVVNSINDYVLVEYMYKVDYEAETISFNPDGSARD